MKKIAVMLAVFVVLGPVPGWCLSTTVDTFIDNRMKSDLSPVADAGKVLDLTNKGVDKTYHLVTDPMDPVLSPVHKVKDGILDGVKKVVNGANYSPEPLLVSPAQHIQFCKRYNYFER